MNYKQSLDYYYDSVCPALNHLNNIIDDLGLKKNAELIYNKIDVSMNDNNGVNTIIEIVDLIIEVCGRENYLIDRKVFNPMVQDELEDLISKLELFKNIIHVERNSIKEVESEKVTVKNRLENTPVKIVQGVDSIYSTSPVRERMPNINKYGIKDDKNEI